MRFPRKAFMFAAFVSPLAILGGQTVTIVIADSTAGTAVANAMVSVRQQDGRIIAQGRSDPDGRVVFSLPLPDRYVVLVRRLGYRPAVVERRASSESPSRIVTIAVPALPITLPTVVVNSERPVCGRQPDAESLPGILWEQTQTALQSALEDSSGSSMERIVIEEVRILDAAGHEVNRIAVRNQVSRANVFASVDPDSIALSGFIVPRPGGSWDVLGPDAHVLASSAFVRSHCFQVAPPDSTSATPFLKFTAIPSDRTANISGAFFLHPNGDRVTVHFRVDAPWHLMPVRDHGIAGRIKFARLRSGMVAVAWWSLKAPRTISRRAGRRAEVRTSIAFSGQTLPLTQEGFERDSASEDVRWIGVKVLDQARRPIPNAFIVLQDSLVAISSAAGEAVFHATHVSRDTAVVLKPGMRGGLLDMQRVRLSGVAQVVLDASLGRDASNLTTDEIEHRSGMRAFLGAAQRIEIAARDDLDPGASLHDALFKLRGDGEEPIQTARVERTGSALTCEPQLFIDGYVARWEFARRLPLHRFSLLYVFKSDSEVPPQFKRSAPRCGAVLAWSQQI